MKVIDVYSQYFSGECVYAGVARRAVLVRLTAESDSGHIRYEVGISFFPHRDEEDFAVSYDACGAETVYDAQGRRSRNREKVFLEELRDRADALAEAMEGKIFWDQPLGEARLG